MARESYDPKSQRPGDQATAANAPQAVGSLPAQVILLQQQPGRTIDTAALLNRQVRVTVAFPPCANELLALVRAGDGDEVSRIFREYFRFLRHHTLGQYYTQVGSDPTQPPTLRELSDDLPTALDPSLLVCRESDDVILSGGTSSPGGWPTECCLCTPCVRLDGNRNRLTPPPPLSPIFPPGGPVEPRIRRLFIGDLLWLFYFDRMGIFQILGAVLDSYASSGRLPISNGSIDLNIKDDIVALVLETMVRQTKMGMSTAVRDRGAAFRTSLGWVSEGARKLNLDTVVNTDFNKHFHAFMYGALGFYKDRSLAVAIRGSLAGATASVATLITIGDTIDVLKKRFEPFAYGRNYYNTLSGIVWVVAAMSVIRELRATLGIAPAYGDAHEFIPAAYDLLVLKRPVTYGEMNRYDLNRICAESGRDILMDMEVINHNDRMPGGDLESWLIQIESKVEAYRTAYRTLTGVDLATASTPAVEQAV
jgi:hypothetical protein